MHGSAIIDVAELLETIDNTVVIDCRYDLAESERGHQLYLADHIPGAYYLDVDKDLSSPDGFGGGRHPLPNFTELAEKLASMGVDSETDTPIVIYDDIGMGYSAFAWWMLRYMGLRKVRVLSGGISAWKAAGNACSHVIPEAKPGRVKLQLHEDWIVDYDTVADRSRNKTATLIDSRDPARFSGAEEPIDSKAGHIPAALNFPWQDCCDEKGEFMPLEWQQQRWQTVKNDRELIVYCGSGITACVNLLSMHEGGIEGAKLYPGSWSDWISHPDAEVVTD